MCGRFNLFTSVEIITEELNVEKVLFDPPPRYNIAPTQTVAAVHEEGGRALSGMRWGLIPPRSADGSASSLLINARCESVFDRLSFGGPILRKRCVLPADGFFEWAHTSAGRLPYYLSRANGGPFYMAGIYEDWRSPEGEDVRSCSILTTAADRMISPIHDRMPLSFDRDKALRYLDPSLKDRERIEPLLERGNIMFKMVRVGTEVNSASAEGEGLIAPLRDWF